MHPADEFLAIPKGEFSRLFTRYADPQYDMIKSGFSKAGPSHLGIFGSSRDAPG